MENSIYIRTEQYKIDESDEGVIVEGLALPVGKPSRNGYLYTKESLEKSYQTLEGKPFLFNHDENRVIGHIEKVWLDSDGLHYRANLDPAEKDIIRKLKRGDIRNVSIQAIVENLRPKENYYECDIKEFLELSAVTIPGFVDTTVSFAEKFLKEEIDRRYQNPDGTFKKMTCPDNPDEESKFCGCVRYFMAKKNLSLDSAKKLCAYIKAKKYGHSYNSNEIDMLVEFLKTIEEVDDMPKVKEQEENPTTPKEDETSVINELRSMIEEVRAKISDLESRISDIEAKLAEKPEKPEETPEEKPEETTERLSVMAPTVKEEVKVSELFKR